MKMGRLVATVQLIINNADIKEYQHKHLNLLSKLMQ